MASMSDKLKAVQELPEVKKVKTDPSNLHISKDDFIEKRRREKEKEARLRLASEEIERQLEEEGQAELKKKKSKKVRVEEPMEQTEEI